MSDNTIKCLPALLSAKLGPNRSIKETKISRLIPKGENYGSEMIKLDFITENESGEEEKLHAVAKTLPASELFREIFHVQNTYTNEMAFYDLIVPTLQNFQKEIGLKDVIDCFPECYATRKNLLEDSDKITADAVIVLENLQVSGFQNIDRTIGFDLETAKLVLRDLALFHAVTLALKLKKPKVFEETLKRFCILFDPSHQDLFPVLRLIVEEDKDCAHVSPKMVAWGTNPRSPINEPYATIVHSDMWSNNTMQNFINDTAVANKFVDFQFFQYGSPAADVFFLLWSSIPQEVLEPNLDYFLKYYHDHFIKALEQHKCDVTPFLYGKFLEEMSSVSDFEFPHAFLFHNLIVNGKKGGSDFENVDVQKIYTDVPLKVKQKSWYMVKECLKRGWLK